MFKRLVGIGLAVVMLNSFVYAQDYKVDGTLGLDVRMSGSFQGFDIDSVVNTKGSLEYINADDKLKLFFNMHMYQDGEETTEPFHYKMFVEKRILEGLEDSTEAEYSQLNGMDTGLYDVYMSVTDSEGKDEWSLGSSLPEDTEKLYLDYSTVEEMLKNVLGVEKKNAKGSIKANDLVDKVKEYLSSDKAVSGVIDSILADYDGLIDGLELNYEVKYKKDLLDKISVSVKDVDISSFINSSSEGMEEMGDIDNLKSTLEKLSLELKFDYNKLDIEIPEEVKVVSEYNYQNDLQEYLGSIIEETETE